MQRIFICMLAAAAVVWPRAEGNTPGAGTSDSPVLVSQEGAAALASRISAALNAYSRRQIAHVGTSDGLITWVPTLDLLEIAGELSTEDAMLARNCRVRIQPVR